MEKSSKISSRMIGKRSFKEKNQVSSSRKRALSGEDNQQNNNDSRALVCPYYIEDIREKDGVLIRYCRVTKNCSQWGKAWEKRVDIIRHIQKKHGISIDIPRRAVGRPKNSQGGPLPVESRSHRQARTRFESIETRIKLARQKHRKDLQDAAERRWLFSSLYDKMPYEEWKAQYMEKEMAEWEKGMPERIAKMRAKIAKGYDEMSRKYKGVKGEEEGNKDDESNDEEESENGSADLEGGSEEDDNNNAVIPPLCITKISSPTKASQKVLNNCDKPSERREKLKVRKIYESKVHIDVSSPSTSMGLSPAKNIRSFAEKVIHLHSALYGLEVQYDTNLARNIATKKASSRTMALFVLWLEDTFQKETLDQVWFIDSLWHSFMGTAPSERAVRNYYGRVDLSSRVFTFFPIVHEDHWTLVVFFNCHVCPISCLPKDKSAILFFDSLSLRSLDRYISPIQRVLQHFSAYATHPQLRMELCHSKDCHVQTMEFTKSWFVHEEVEAMKIEFGSWAQESVVDITKLV